MIDTFDDLPRKCIDCNGHGGDYDRRDHPPTWKRCSSCYGFGLRSVAADRWFNRQVVTASLAIPRLER